MADYSLFGWLAADLGLSFHQSIISASKLTGNQQSFAGILRQ
jgi:hypothetical protein